MRKQRITTFSLDEDVRFYLENIIWTRGKIDALVKENGKMIVVFTPYDKIGEEDDQEV